MTALATGIAFFLILLASVKPLGTYMDDVFAGRRTVLSRVLAPVESAVIGSAVSM